MASITHALPEAVLSLNRESTLLQETIQRVDGLDHDEPFIICNEEHRFIMVEQLRAANYKSSAIILEPVGRNTAPAPALAALQAVKNGQDPLLLVFAVDHIIKNKTALQSAVAKAVVQAKKEISLRLGLHLLPLKQDMVTYNTVM